MRCTCDVPTSPFDTQLTAKVFVCVVNSDLRELIGEVLYFKPGSDDVNPQDIVSALEDRLRPLVQAELSVLVDVLHRPELLFPENTEARKKCESGGFISKYATTFDVVYLRWRRCFSLKKGNSFGER